MSKALLIVFVKNAKLGKVKTRLARDIGEQKALDIYKKLIIITREAVEKLDVDKRIYFSNLIDDEGWESNSKYVQKGIDLGERMANAFEQGFKDAYNKIILIGSDLPDLTSEAIKEGFKALEGNELVFGPAEDGGYYLIGMNKMNSNVFKNKKWSTETLLNDTLNELKNSKAKVSLLETLNDVDTLDDLKRTKLYFD